MSALHTFDEVHVPPSPQTKLLLVDDDRLVLATISVGLQKLNYFVVTADCAERALVEAKGQAFDLAILDIRMDGMTGIELARQLLHDYGLPSLFLTAFDECSTVSQAVAEGGLGYVVKPIDVLRLAPAIEAAMARARDLKALFEVNGQLKQALAGGRQTSMAIGILMERYGLTEQDAFQRLRNEARQKRRKLEDHCVILVRERGGKAASSGGDAG